MNFLQQEEAILSDLTSLYESRGYKKYKPSCFEEYSLYLENRDFLISKNVLTFNGASGRLLALRPDVTLSIVNHTKADYTNTEKLFYTEKVYRQIAGNVEFKEISQTGVEVIGNVDNVCQIEISLLILKTLASISENYILDISHMGFTEGLISSFGLSAADKMAVYGFLKNKNIHDFLEFAASVNLSDEQIRTFIETVNISGNAKIAVEKAKQIALNGQMKQATEDLEGVISALTSFGYGDNLNINFSIVNNADYYNGIIFNGYIDGVPKAVLSGGRYDKLLQKFGKNAGAIGFALYLGEIETYFKNYGNEVDYLIIYNDSMQNAALQLAYEHNSKGKKVRLSREINSDIRYSEIIDLTAGGNV